MSVQRILLWVMLVGALIVALWMFVLPRVIFGLACDHEADRQALDAQTDFYCPVNNKIVYDAWGECGLKKECLDPKSGVADGSKFAALGGRLQSKTLYSQGKQVGGWTGYDRDGKANPEGGGYQVPAKPSTQH
ncbi:MAG: hypothetical protein LBL59_06710 [Xanthomonadaceae bacterium]|jgi:hypothetical protein|nr:hypothetical protein [Xanthomonadaceae bacterium]